MHKSSTNVRYTVKKKTKYRFFVSRNAKEIEDTCTQDAFVVQYTIRSTLIFVFLLFSSLQKYSRRM